jgi:iron complex outermembrane receptor protein
MPTIDISHARCWAARLSGAALAVLAGAAGSTAWAVNAPADAGGGSGLSEVVVTAEKKEKSLQKTPIAISVLGSADLENRHVQSLEDLVDGTVPTLRIAPFFARSSALTLGMRGIGALGDANQPARDQAVGVYIDGVYLGRAQGLGSALYDVERIEVLRGPQGTLFGRNTEGGAISIITRKPTGRFRMNAIAGYGNYNGYKAEAHVDMPQIGALAFKFDALLSRRDGTVKNPTTSGQPDFNSYDKRGFHAAALWRPLRDLSAEYAFDTSYDGTTPYYVNLLSQGALALAPLIHVQPQRVSRANIGVPLQLSEGRTHGHRLTLDWAAMEGLQVKAIGSFRRLDQSQFDNAETVLSAFAPNGFFSRYSLAQVHQEQYSGELQVLGKLPGLELVGGAFYYHERVSDNAQTPNSLQWNATGTAYSLVTLDFNTVPFDRASHVRTQSAGVFAQGVWTPPILDGITHLTLGGRYTHDAKKGALDVVNGKAPSYVDLNKTVITGIIPLDEAWSRFDPLVNLSVDATPDVHVYGRWSTGYKAGGANSRSLTYRAFDPETVSMFEAGAKTEFLDHRVRLNAAAFTGELKDAQVDFNVIVLNNNRGTLETTNAATGRTKGVEVDLTIAPMEGLTLTGSYAHTKVTLSQAFNPFTNTNAVVYPLFSPENAGAVAVDYEHPVMGALFQAHLDANFSDGQYTSSTDNHLSDPSTVVNGRIALSDIPVADGLRLQVAVWSRNLLNEQHAFLRNFNASLGTYGIFNEPRTFGIEASIRY